MLLGSPPHPVPESWESSSSRVYSPQRVYSPKRQRPPEPVAESSQSSSSRVYSPNFRSGDAAFNEHFVKRMDAVVQEIPYGNGGGGAALVLEEVLPYGNGDAALVLEEVVSRSATPIDRSATPTRKVAQLAMPLRQTKINSPRTGANSPPTARYSPRGTPSAPYRMIPAEVSGGGSLKVSRRISRGSRISGGSVQEDVHRGGSLTTPTTIYGGSLTAPTPSLRSGGAATPSVTLAPEPSPYSVATGSTLTSGAPNYTRLVREHPASVREQLVREHPASVREHPTSGSSTPVHSTRFAAPLSQQGQPLSKLAGQQPSRMPNFGNGRK